MKKTKLLTSLAALALVVSLGACDQTIDDESTDEGSETTETGETDDSTESTQSSETSEQKEIDGDPVADILSGIADGESFTLEAYYWDYITVDYDTFEEAQAATSYDYYTEADVITTYTKDAVVIEYYLYGELYDVEGYLNDYDDAVYESDLTLIFYIDDETGALYNTWYGYYGVWQDVLDSPLGIVEYADAFTKGDVSTGDYGTVIDYDIDFTIDGLLSAIINDLFIAENWFAYYDLVGGPSHILELAEEDETNYFDYASTYYVDLEQWEIEFQTADLIWTDSSFDFTTWSYVTTYHVERNYMAAAIYDVGTTVIDPQWAQYLVLE